MLGNLLQGKPFGYPLHTMLVHLPIGLFVLSFVLDVAAWIMVSEALSQAAWYAMAGGIGTALLAALPGVVDWTDIRVDHPAKKTATTHMILNLLAVGLYVINLLVFRLGPLAETAPPLASLALSLVGVSLLGLSGFLGGKIVYEDGLGVGQHMRDTKTPARTIKVSAKDAQQGRVAVADLGDLEEGETRRLDVDGFILTLAHQGGKYYAFQEFCTHRYGPLSEGKLQDGQVTCPWHGSCFDMRTGQPTQGPAKAALKTYGVLVMDGKLYVELKPQGTNGQKEKQPAKNGHQRKEPARASQR